MLKALVFARKEVRDIVTERKMALVYILMVLSVLVPTMGSVKSYFTHWVTTDQSPTLVNYVGGGVVAPLIIFLWPLIHIAPILGIFLGFEAVNREWREGSLKVALSYPIYRDQVLLGKLLGGVFTLAVITASSLLLGLGALVGFTRIDVTLELCQRWGAVLMFALLYTSVYYFASAAFSIIFKTPEASMLASTILYFLTIHFQGYLNNLVSLIREDYNLYTYLRKIIEAYYPGALAQRPFFEFLEIAMITQVEREQYLVGRSFDFVFQSVLPSFYALAVYSLAFLLLGFLFFHFRDVS
jgi:ABC-type transport system involved in multi-copper enzyme maturation permease subunit